jgi:hypothetical protein
MMTLHWEVGVAAWLSLWAHQPGGGMALVRSPYASARDTTIAHLKATYSEPVINLPFANLGDLEQLVRNLADESAEVAQGPVLVSPFDDAFPSPQLRVPALELLSDQRDRIARAVGKLPTKEIWRTLADPALTNLKRAGAALQTVKVWAEFRDQIYGSNQDHSRTERIREVRIAFMREYSFSAAFSLAGNPLHLLVPPETPRYRRLSISEGGAALRGCAALALRAWVLRTRQRPRARLLRFGGGWCVSFRSSWLQGSNGCGGHCAGSLRSS